MRFLLDGRPVVLENLKPTTTLLETLRDHLRVTGPKEGCAEGDCGACSVAILDGDRWRAIDSCLVLLPQIDGAEIVTAEGLGPDHPVSKALVDRLASQCGYCTPGIAASLFEACHRRDLDAPWKLDDQLCGNLCRCTGYRPIRDAAADVAGTAPADAFAGRTAPPPGPVDHEGGGARFVAPVTLDRVFDALDAGAQPVAGATDLGLDVNKKHAAWALLVGLDRVPALTALTDGDPVEIGAAARLADVEAWAVSALPPLARMLRYFGSRQIKNRGTLGGNLCTASPIGDTAPVLLALDATLIAASRTGERAIRIDDWFVGYRKTALRPGELLARVRVPKPPPGARVGVYKVSRRREMDISAVSAAFLVETDAAGVVTRARLAFGGMAATPKRAAAAEAALVGAAWTGAAVEAAVAALDADFAPIDDARASAWYRRTVAGNLLRGFFDETRDTAFRALPDRPTSTFAGEAP